MATTQVIRDQYGNQTASGIKQTVVYELGNFGLHSPKAGQRYSLRRRISDSYNNSGAQGGLAGLGHDHNYHVNGDATGKTVRLQLNGVQSKFAATLEDDGHLLLPRGLSLQPQGEIL